MTVIGAAEIVVTPNTTLFRKELEGQTSPAFGGLRKDAERAGEESGTRLSKGFGKGVGGVSSALAGVGIPLGNFGNRLTESAGGLAKVDHESAGLTRTLSTLGGGTLAVASAGLIGFGVAGVLAAGKYKSATTTIAANSNIGVEAAKRISDSFLKTTGKTIYSAQEIATAYGEVAGVLGELNGKALTAAQADEFMAASMDLAEGAGVKLGTATSALSKIMQAYHLDVNEAAGAGDILFNTSRVTGIEMDQLVAVLSRVKGKLGDLAPSLGESAGLLDALAKNGITGRVAISSLSGGFNSLIGGGEEATAMAKRLGLTIFDSSGKFVGMKSIIAQLNPVLSHLSQQQQLQTTKALFGGSANRQLLGVILQGPRAFAAHTAAVTRAGAAQQAAEKQSKTFGHQVDLLKATAVDLGIKIGNALVPKLTVLATKLADGITWLTKHKEVAKALAITIASVLGVAVSTFVGTKAIAFVGAIKNMASAASMLASRLLTVLIPAFSTAEAEIVAGARGTAAGVDAAFMTTIVGVAIVGLTVAAYELATHWEESMNAIENAVESAANFVIEQLNEIIKGVNETIEVLTLGLAPAIDEVGKMNGNEGIPRYTKKEEDENENEENQAMRQYKGGKGMEGSIFKSLTAGGLSNTAAAGIIKALGGESALSPTNEGSEGAYGLAQWLGPRRKELEQFAGQTHQSGNAVSTQIQFLLKDLHGPEKHTLGVLKGAHSAEDAERKFVELYERPKKSEIPKILSRGQSYGHGAEGHTKAVGNDTAAVEKHTHTMDLGTEVAKKAAKHHAAKTKAASDKEITAWATAHIGKYAENEGKNRGTELDKLEKQFGMVGQSWCAMFASTAAVMGGASASIKSASVAQLKEWAASGTHGFKKGVLSGSHAKAGDLLAFGNEHVGFVQSVSGGKIHTIEGNTSSGKVAKETHSFSEGSILRPVYKGSAALEKASKSFELIVKQEQKKQTADLKTGQSALNKMVSAIHSGGVKQLTAVVGGKHDSALKRLENKLHADHSSKLDELVKKLVSTHRQALEALQKALVKAAEEASAKRLKYEDTINADIAEGIATQAADASKVTIDRLAEAGKTGADLLAAQAQTNLDITKQSDDAAIASAKQAADRAVGAGELAEAVAQQNLANAENAAKIAEAKGQAVLDLANQGAAESQAAQTRATEDQTRATEEQTKATEAATTATESAPAAGQQITLNIYEPTSAAGVITELGWAIKTGMLPAPKTTVPAAA